MSDLTSSGPHSFDPADRRDSPRVPMRFHVRPIDGDGDFQLHEGDLSIGGALFHTAVAGAGDLYQIKFRLPDQQQEILCKAEVLRVRDAGSLKRVHLKFVELSLEQELGIARYIDNLIASLGS
ncbi:MAG: PilZ domain-containing protein [Myxococcota bacterium]|nr:PilZ domain-containing protein [Myxococcota bacterium]